MITEESIRSLVEEKIAKTDQFIVDLKVHSGNKIVIFLDSDTNITISDCVAVSRHIEGSLDREEHDFELSVSTAGVGQGLQNLRQYKKNIGRTIQTKLIEGKSIEGELKEVNENDFLLVSRKKERIEGRKSKEWVETEHLLQYSDIIETKVLITFK